MSPYLFGKVRVARSLYKSQEGGPTAATIRRKLRPRLLLLYVNVFPVLVPVEAVGGGAVANSRTPQLLVTAGRRWFAVVAVGVVCEEGRGRFNNKTPTIVGR
jgi:hypothetical protein